MAALKLPIDEVVHFTVTTRDPATGGESDATGDVVFNIYEEATDTPIAGSPITMTKRTSLTGRYRGTFTMSAANGFEAGKFYDVIVSGTVVGVTDNAPVMLIHCVPAESVVGVPKVDQHALGGDAQSTTDLKDFADAGYDPATNKVQGVVLVDTLTTYTGNTPQTADHAASIALILADTNELQTDWVNGGRLDLILDATATASALASLVTTVGVAGAGLTAADDAVIAAIAALNNVSTAQVQTAAAAALTAYDPPTNAEFEARTLVAANYFDPAADTVANVTTVGSVTTKTGYALTSDYDFAKGTVAVTEAYAADGAAPTPVQALMLIQQALTEFTISGTTTTIKKLDGSTTAASLTLNNATTPTGVTRSG
jgi:hypothetical protein